MPPLTQPTRVTKDITMFETNITKLPPRLPDKTIAVIILAKQYYEDTKYYANKHDYFTAFGCINYAHGLLDAILKTTTEDHP
jgi:uncharacterized protein